MSCSASEGGQKVAAALEGYSDDAVWAEIERSRGGSSSGPAKTIKQAEIETLLSSPDAIGKDRIEGDFYARRWRPEAPLDAIWNKIDRVVLSSTSFWVQSGAREQAAPSAVRTGCLSITAPCGTPGVYGCVGPGRSGSRV